MEDVEFENLQTLRRFLTSHDRIMVNIATIIRHEQNVGKVHYIFYDLAAYSLKTFLKQAEGSDAKERREKEHQRRSETAPPERNGSHDWNEGDLIKESHRLADALDFLHKRLYNDAEYSLAHNDLKPENILVFYPDSQNPDTKFPVGQWKIADFGLAKIKEGRRLPKTKFVSFSTGDPYRRQNLSPEPVEDAMVEEVDLTHRRARSASGASFRSEDMTKSKRDPGRYSGPEIEGRGEPQPDARSGDIWAFGCVLAEVLAFAVNPSLVDELREVCERPGHYDQRFYDTETKKTKLSVLDWLKNLHLKCESRVFGDEWVKRCAEMMCDKILVPDPRHRYKAGEIRGKLLNIHEDMVKRMQQRLELKPGQLRLHDEFPPCSPVLSDRSEALESPKGMDEVPQINLSPPNK